MALDCLSTLEESDFAEAGVKSNCMARSKIPGTNGNKGLEEALWWMVLEISEVDVVGVWMGMSNFEAPLTNNSLKMLMSSICETLGGWESDSVEE